MRGAVCISAPQNQKKYTGTIPGPPAQEDARNAEAALWLHEVQRRLPRCGSQGPRRQRWPHWPVLSGTIPAGGRRPQISAYRSFGTRRRGRVVRAACAKVSGGFSLRRCCVGCVAPRGSGRARRSSRKRRGRGSCQAALPLLTPRLLSPVPRPLPPPSHRPSAALPRSAAAPSSGVQAASKDASGRTHHFGDHLGDEHPVKERRESPCCGSLPSRNGQGSTGAALCVRPPWARWRHPLTARGGAAAAI